MTGDEVVGPDFDEPGSCLGAILRGLGAAGMEAAARGRVQGAGHFALQGHLWNDLGIGNRLRIQQGTGVRVRWSGIQLVSRRKFHQAP